MLKDMEYHCYTQCPNFKFKCSQCEQEVQPNNVEHRQFFNEDFTTHYCIAHLKSQLQSKDLELTFVKNKLALSDINSENMFENHERALEMFQRNHSFSQVVRSSKPVIEKPADKQ